MDTFIKQIIKTINKYNLLSGGECILIGISGGADSVALFYGLFALSSDWGFKLHLAHLNHMFRGRAADEDAEFVRKLADKHDIPCYIEAYDVPSYIKERKLSPQDAARRIRYRFFEEIAANIGADKIALGHHADDQAETMLMRIIQGAGSEGLSGIPVKREKYIRPLIETGRAQIKAYLGVHKISYRDDASNFSDKYLRNRIRLELLPLLKQKYNPAISSNLIRLAEILQADNECLADHVNTLLPELAGIDKEKISIDLRKFNAESISIRRYLLRTAIEKIKGDLRHINFKHIQELVELALGNLGHKQLNLPKHIYAYKDYNSLTISRSPVVKQGRLSYNYLLNIPGITLIPAIGLQIRAEIAQRCQLGAYPAGYQAVINYDKINMPLYVRNKKTGDRFFPLGASGSKKLKDFFIDQKIPAKKRADIPLIVCGDEIIWVAGVRICEQYKITPDTDKALWLSLEAV